MGGMDVGIFILALAALLSWYGGMHYYAYRKFVGLFPLQRRLAKWILVGLGCSVFVVEALTHTGFHQYFAPLAWLSFFWSGYIFLFFFVSGLVDVVVLLVGRVGGQRQVFRVHERLTTIALANAALLISIAGVFSARSVTVELIGLSSPRLTAPLRIVQITDLHLGLLSDAERLRAVVEQINALEPDVIVSTGDLVDMQMDHLDGISGVLKGLRAPSGKFAVYGNHEVYAGLAASREFTEHAGFRVLSNTTAALDGRVSVVGVDDPSVSGRGPASPEVERRLLQNVPEEQFTILLKHQPVVSAAELFDLQLSGHTHGGQIFPFGLLTRLVYSAPFGLSKAGDRGWLYVSRGTGTWGPPIRVLASPEISVFDLRPVTSSD